VARRAYKIENASVVDYLKDDSDNFTFERVRGLRVSFARASIKRGDVEGIKGFIKTGVKY